MRWFSWLAFAMSAMIRAEAKLSMYSSMMRFFMVPK